MRPFCSFGAAHNADCIVPCATMLDFYNGGGVDMACLGAAEVALLPCLASHRSPFPIKSLLISALQHYGMIVT